MKLKSTLTFIAVAMITFSMTFAPSIMQMDKVFALDLGGITGGSSNPLQGLFGGSSSSDNNNPLKNLFGGDTSSPDKSSSSTTNPSQSSPDKSSPSDSSSGSSTSGSDNSGSGATCGSSGKSTFHWYCKGTHHHCLEGEDDCLLFGGRTK
ncbi:MAG: hypothetical protein ACTHKK_04535 [Candidatus Nitrosocosmicus sp.]